MEKTVKIVAVLVSVLLLSQGAGLAKLVNGKVVSVSGDSFELKRVNPVTGEDETVKIATSQNTFYTGISSLNELKANDQVWADTMPDAAPGTWKAVSVRKA